MPPLPAFLAPVFVLTTALAVGIFYVAAHRAKWFLGLMGAWLLLQGSLALSGFYTVTGGLPPRLALALGPPLLGLVSLRSRARGRAWLDSLRLETLTLLHTVRLPVELVLWSLYQYHAVPRLMTFEARNWDVLFGLSAPPLYWLAFRGPRVSRRLLLSWNVLGLASLLNIVANAVLSVPTPLQRFAFEQPNVAILYFPFTWLPAVVVPLMLLAHLAAMMQTWPRRALTPAPSTPTAP